MYLDRDVPNPIQPEKLDDYSPIDIDLLFRMHIHSALTIAKEHCEKLRENTAGQKSAVDFWTDMVDDLKQIELDIKLMTV